MQIAITGATGFLGRALVRELSSQPNCRLVLLGRTTNRLAEYFGSSPHDLVVTDYSIEKLTAALKSCDALVHLAAKRYLKAERWLHQYYENVLISENLLQVCEELGIEICVFASTCSIYSNRVNRLPFREDEYVSPRNAYAISKLIVETLSGLSPVRLVSLRFAQLVGLGEREGYMVSTFIRNALLRQPIIIFGKGQGKRDYLYVRDAARAIVYAFKVSSACGIFNIGSGVATSPVELAELARETFSDNESDILFDPLRPDDPSEYQLDITRAGEHLGWSPAYSLQEALEEMKREYDTGLVE